MKVVEDFKYLQLLNSNNRDKSLLNELWVLLISLNINQYYQGGKVLDEV